MNLIFYLRALFISSVWALPLLKCYKTQKNARDICVSKLTSETTSISLCIWTGTKSLVTLWVSKSGLHHSRDRWTTNAKPMLIAAAPHCPSPSCLQCSKHCIECLLYMSNLKYLPECQAIQYLLNISKNISGKLYNGSIALVAGIIFSIALWLQLSVLTADYPEQMCSHHSDPDWEDYI